MDTVFSVLCIRLFFRCIFGIFRLGLRRLFGRCHLFRLFDRHIFFRCLLDSRLFFRHIPCLRCFILRARQQEKYRYYKDRKDPNPELPDPLHFKLLFMIDHSSIRSSSVFESRYSFVTSLSPFQKAIVLHFGILSHLAAPSARQLTGARSFSVSLNISPIL